MSDNDATTIQTGADNTSGQGLAYAVDLALVIDATASMRPVIDEVKAQALRFHEQLQARLAAKSKRVDQLRVRVVTYRDFAADASALEASEFFTLPDEREAYAAFVNRIDAAGGGDEPESGLDAVAYAIDSDWVRDHDKRRHVIVVFTDASSHPLAHNTGHGQYPHGIASTMDELSDRWDGDGQVGGMEPSAKRLLLFTPDGAPWTELSSFEYAIHFPSRAGHGIADHEYDSILDLIAGSV